MGNRKLSLYTKKTGILRTFEIFNREHISQIKDKVIKIILVESENIFSKNRKLFNIDLKSDNSPQVTIFNDKETYHLLSGVLKRQKLKNGINNDKNHESSIFDKLSHS